MRSLPTFVALAAIAAVAPITPALASEAPAAAETAAKPAPWVQRGFEFAFPVYEMMRTRTQYLSQDGRTPNQLFHRPVLSQAKDRQVTAPNNDTLYSSAWLDLSGGPVLLEVPEMGARYHSVELMDLFTDAFRVIGTRSDHGKAGKYLIVGPTWKGKPVAGAEIVRATTNDVWLLGRTLVNNPDDLPAAQKDQQGYRLTALGKLAPNRAFGMDVPRRPTPDEFLNVVNAALARGPLPAVHKARIASFAAAGVRPGARNSFATLSATQQAEWRRTLPMMYADLADAFTNLGMDRGTWRHPAPGLAEFGTDDRYRSIVALGGLAALPLREATYRMTRVDEQGGNLDGSNDYVLRLPAKIPVDGFWSVTLYEQDEDGRWFFYVNPLNRYSVGNRTQGLVRDADGGVTIHIQNGQPASGNWLPAPKGSFRLSFRAYLPHPEMSDGSFLLPPVRKAP